MRVEYTYKLYKGAMEDMNLSRERKTIIKTILKMRIRKKVKYDNEKAISLYLDTGFVIEHENNAYSYR